MRGWVVARRNFLEGPDAGYRGRRTLSALANHSKSSSTLFSHALSLRTKTSRGFDVSFAPPDRGNATLAVEHATFHHSNLKNLAGESDIEVDDPESLSIEPSHFGVTVIEEHDRWAPVVTVEDAERVFKRTKPSRSGYLEEAIKYQAQ